MPNSSQTIQASHLVRLASKCLGPIKGGLLGSTQRMDVTNIVDPSILGLESHYGYLYTRPAVEPSVRYIPYRLLNKVSIRISLIRKQLDRRKPVKVTKKN